MQQKWLRVQTSPTQLSVNLFKFEIKSWIFFLELITYSKWRVGQAVFQQLFSWYYVASELKSE